MTYPNLSQFVYETHEMLNDIEAGNEKRDDKIEELQCIVDDLEQNDRLGNLIMTGLKESKHTPGMVTKELNKILGLKLEVNTI